MTCFDAKRKRAVAVQVQVIYFSFVVLSLKELVVMPRKLLHVVICFT